MAITLEDDDVSLNGGIEVITMIDERGRKKDKIMYIAPRSKQQPNSRHESVMQTIANSLFSGCCQSYYPKSALKKKDAIPDPARTVSWNSIDIKEFDLTLGDHPSAVTGPPVALNWDKVASQRTVNLDEYERARLPRRRRRQLKIPNKVRREVLQQQFTDEQVNQAWSEALQIRMQRRETLQRGPLGSMMDDFWESAGRKYERMTTGLCRCI